MKRFVQLHFLTAYPPSNLNRDDLGRPKTAVMGGANRLRVSSQSLKRAWRTSDVFQSAMADNLGVRTKWIGKEWVFDRLVENGIKEKEATAWAKMIAGQFGKVGGKKGDEAVTIEQLAHVSPEERKAVESLVEKLIAEKRAPEEGELELLRHENSAADIALFGRMLASHTAFNMEAAAQVAHAVTVHKCAVEDDYFTAVDDLNTGEEDAGAAHVGETEFGSGLFYLYACIDRELLVENLGGDRATANKALAALIESAATVSPTGKQNSFASRARASYILCECGNQQPRSLAVAFYAPVKGDNLLEKSVKALREEREKMDAAYGKCADKRAEMDLYSGKGTLAEIIKTATE